MTARRGTRILKGLSLDNVVDDVPESVEEDEQPLSTNRRSRRERNNDVIYDSKYHPMDNVTRPNMAATLRNRSKSVSFGTDDNDDDGGSEMSSLPSSDGEEEQDDDDPDNITVFTPRVTPRSPDPRAVRFSSRNQARKPVNYSKNHHPQDYGLPGFQHRAQVVTQPGTCSLQKKRKQPLLTPDDDDQMELMQEVDAEAGDESRRPRKKLRSLHPNISSSPGFARVASQHQTQRQRNDENDMQSSTSDDIADVTDMAIAKVSSQHGTAPDDDTNAAAQSLSDGIDDLVDMALLKSQPPPRMVSGLPKSTISKGNEQVEVSSSTNEQERRQEDERPLVIEDSEEDDDISETDGYEVETEPFVPLGFRQEDDSSVTSGREQPKTAPVSSEDVERRGEDGPSATGTVVPGDVPIAALDCQRDDPDEDHAREGSEFADILQDSLQAMESNDSTELNSSDPLKYLPKLDDHEDLPSTDSIGPEYC